MERRVFQVRGLDCAEEVAILRREVGPLVGGGERLAFDVLKGRMWVLPEPGRSAAATAATDADIRAAVARAGMRAERVTGKPERAERAGPARRRALLPTAASGAAAALGFAVQAVAAGGVAGALVAPGPGAGPPVPWAARLLYLAAIVAGGWFVYPKAWRALRRLHPDMNLLMTVAVVGAVGLGEWLEAASVAFLFALANALEAWSVGRARHAVEALLDLSPPTARRLGPGGAEEEVAAGELAVGDRFVVRPGERVPLDGEVVAGSSEVDQAPITGESAPVAKAPGAEVFAGTINGDGALEVRATRPADDTTLARIIRLVDEARTRRSPSERWVERFARVYTPAVMLIAVAVFLVPPLAVGAAWSEWFYRALVVLVIGCPCALVISTPVSVVSALAAAARRGVLIKGGAFVEAPAALRAMAFDKTGTLTRGTPSLVAAVPLNGHTADELVARAAALEARSAHPLARAIVADARARGLEVQPAADAQALAGKGVVGSLGGARYWLGSHRYLEERGQEVPEVHRRLEEMAAGGRTVVAVGNDRHVCGLLAVADALRPEARDAVAALRRLGVERLVMLTGDNRPTAAAIAADLGGVDEVRAELLPEEKVAAIEELVGRHGTVAMVGDGVNDAPAMARSSLAIAMGAAGSDAAIETADVALMSDDLGGLPWLVAHSRRTVRVIRANIVVALAVKVAVFGLAAAGTATLWMAIAADMGASLLVTANALRLLRQ